MGLGDSYDRWKSTDTEGIPPVVLASGPETELKEECLGTLRDQFEGDPEEITFYADEATPEDFIQELRGRGLFNDAKIVVLKHLERRASGQGRQMARYESVVEDYLEDPEDGVLLFLMDQDHPYRQSRRTGSVAATVQNAGGDSIIFWEPFDDSLRDHVRSTLSDAGVRINPPAVQALLERTRGKFSRIKREVAKLVDSVEDTVTVSDVESLVSREQAADGLQALKDDLVAGEPGQLMTDLEDLWRQGEAPPKVLYVLFSFLNSVREVKQLRSSGESLESALSKAGLPDNKSVTKLFKRATNPGGVSLPRDFFRRSYETSRNAKYSEKRFARRVVEFFTLRLRGSR